MNTARLAQHDRSPIKRNWLKRLGWAGFLFFLIKGLVWLAIFFGIGTWFSS